MYQETQTANMNVLLEKIEEFLETVPADGNEQVDWDELATRKQNARISLDLLTRMFGQGLIEYSGDDPGTEPKNSRLYARYICQGDKPKPGNEHLAVKYTCSGAKPEPKESRLDTVYV